MRRHLPSLNALRSFEAAARHGSMTRAADALGVTHGAVSRQVRGLEADLGVGLLDNRRGRLQLTASGAQLLGVLEDAFGRIARGIEDVSMQASGDIAVSSFGSFAMRWLIPRLHRFQAAQPGLIVRLTTSDPELDLGRGGFDIAIRVAKSWPKNVEAVPLFAEYAGPVLAPNLAKKHKLASPAALTKLPLLHTATRSDAWAEWFAGRRVALPQKKMAGQDFEHAYFMLEAAQSGLGAAIGFWHLVADDVKSRRLVAPFGFAPTGRHYAALIPARSQRAATKAFAIWLREEAEGFMKAHPPQ